MKKFEIAVIPGDGIGQEVLPEAIKVLDTVAELHGGIKFEYTHFPWGCDYYMEHNEMMPKDGINRLSNFDSVFLGAVGNPKLVPDHISLWGLLLKIRREFEQNINLRPAKIIKGIASPLKDPKDFDLIVVRENSEGEYSEIGGRLHKGEGEIAIQNAVFTRKATSNAMRFAFNLAESRNKKLTSATKSNGLFYSMPFWDEVFNEMKQDYKNIDTNSIHIDALAAFFVSRPEEFDVIVASNLFGDILTDLAASIMGSIGVAPAANINLEGKYPSMFEPVHGSAPDIAGKGIANPIGQIWTGKMMLDHFGLGDMGDIVLHVIESVTGDGIKTPDIGGTHTTQQVSEEICKQIKNYK